MRILIFSSIFALSLVLFAAPQSTTYETCPQSKTAPPKVISITFDYAKGHGNSDSEGIGFPALPGADADRKSINEIAQRLYNDNNPLRVTENFFSQYSGAPDSPALMKQERDKFLSVIKNAVGKLDKNADKTVMYSGHGDPCIDRVTKVEHWCMELPLHPDLQRTKDANGNYVIYTDDPFVVSDVDLATATGANNFIFDSCHSELAGLRIQQKLVNSHPTIISSSLTNSAAISSSLTGGRLIERLKMLSESLQNPSICALDFDGSGEISSREATLVMQLSLLQSEDNATLQQVLDDAHALRFANAVDLTSLTPDALTNQMFSGIVNNACFMKIPASLNCPKPPAAKTPSFAGAAYICEKTRIQHDFMFKKMNDLIRNPKTLKSILNVTSDTVPPVGILQLQQDSGRADAVKYLKDWLHEVQTEDGSCGAARQTTGDSTSSTCNQSTSTKIYNWMKNLLTTAVKN